VVLVLGLSGCSRAPFKLRFEPTGSALTGPATEKLAASTDISSLASVTTTEAPAVRVTALNELRTMGPLGIRAADLLTIGFPARTAAVPVLVRICAVDGTDCVLVVEAFGDPGGTLTHRRLWVFDRATGAVVRAASFR
jgi:hypothetical protein